MAKRIVIREEYLQQMEATIYHCIDDLKRLLKVKMPRLFAFLQSENIQYEHFALDWYATYFRTAMDEEEAAQVARVYNQGVRLVNGGKSMDDLDDFSPNSDKNNSDGKSKNQKNKNQKNSSGHQKTSNDHQKNNVDPKLVLHGTALVLLEMKAEEIFNQKTREKALRVCKTKVRLAWDDEPGLKIEDVLSRARF